MKLSVATIGYKSLRNIQNVVGDIKESTIPAELVVVINNYGNVSDGITDYVRSAPVARWVRCSQNVGCAKAFNIGMSLCTGDVVVALNDDCRVGDDTYEKILEEFNDPRVGIVGVAEGRLKPLSYSEKCVDGTAVQGFLIAFRKKMLDEIGMYDPVASPLADEVELQLRAVVAGWKIVIARDVMWQHVFDISCNTQTKIMYQGEEWIPARDQPKTNVYFDRIRADLARKLQPNDF